MNLRHGDVQNIPPFVDYGASVDLDGKVMTHCTHWKIGSLSKQLLLIDAMYNIYVEKNVMFNKACWFFHPTKHNEKNHFGYKSFNQ